MKKEINILYIQYLTPVVKYLTKREMTCALLHHTGNTAGLTGQSDSVETME